MTNREKLIEKMRVMSDTGLESLIIPDVDGSCGDGVKQWMMEEANDDGSKID